MHRGLNRLLAISNEKQRRLTAGFEAARLGWGGVTQVAQITGLSRTTILQGIRDMEAQVGTLEEIRKSGAGRPPVEKKRRTAPAQAPAAPGRRHRRRSDERDQVEPKEHPEPEPGVGT